MPNLRYKIYCSDEWRWLSGLSCGLLAILSIIHCASREITLIYNNGKKTETFVGVLQQGYKVKLKDGSLAEPKLSMIPAGTRLKVYYIAKNRKVNGLKEKFYEIFRMDFPTT